MRMDILMFILNGEILWNKLKNYKKLIYIKMIYNCRVKFEIRELNSGISKLVLRFWKIYKIIRFKCIFPNKKCFKWVQMNSNDFEGISKKFTRK